jgi:hypothetical protein
LTDLLNDESVLNKLNWEFPVPFIANEFSPFREFYNIFPEGFLTYINEQKIQDHHLLEDFNQIVKFSFARYGIDFANPTFNLKDARERLYLYFKSKRKEMVRKQRLKEMFESDTVLKAYLQSRIDFSKDLFDETNTSSRDTSNIYMETMHGVRLTNRGGIERNGQRVLVPVFYRNKSEAFGGNAGENIATVGLRKGERVEQNPEHFD